MRRDPAEPPGTCVAAPPVMQRVLSILLLSPLPACGLFADDANQQLPPCRAPDDGAEDPADCHNLYFHGIQPVHPNFPAQLDVNNHIAVDGTHEVTLALQSDSNDLTVAYDATTSRPATLSVESISGPHITLRAEAAGLDDLVITDPVTGALSDRAPYAMSKFARAVPVATEEIYTSSEFFTATAERYVFAPATRRIGVAYLNAAVPANRLVDTSATLASDAATQTGWDTVSLDDPSVGMHAINLTVGGVESTIQFEVVGGVDSVESLFTYAGITCFGAFTSNVFVAGLEWTVAVDGVVATAIADSSSGLVTAGPNSVLYDGSTPHEITATAGGKSLTVTSP